MSLNPPKEPKELKCVPKLLDELVLEPKGLQERPKKSSSSSSKNPEKESPKKDLKMSCGEWKWKSPPPNPCFTPSSP
jgi:hypothetical protein